MTPNEWTRDDVRNALGQHITTYEECSVIFDHGYRRGLFLHMNIAEHNWTEVRDDMRTDPNMLVLRPVPVLVKYEHLIVQAKHYTHLASGGYRIAYCPSAAHAHKDWWVKAALGDYLNRFRYQFGFNQQTIDALVIQHEQVKLKEAV